jgi:hypothetical protein
VPPEPPYQALVAPIGSGGSDRIDAGDSIDTPSPIIRPHTAFDTFPDLANPHFSNCTIPVVFFLYGHYNIAGTWGGRVLVKSHALVSELFYTAALCSVLKRCFYRRSV